MKRRIGCAAAGIAAGMALCYLLIAAGFAICCTNPTTYILSQLNSDWRTSAYPQRQLVDLAQTTRAYTVEGIDADELYAAIGEAARALPAEIVLHETGRDALLDDMDTAPAGRYLAACTDTLSLPSDAVGHLDSVRAVVQAALWALLACALVFVLCAWWLRRHARPVLSTVLIAASAGTVALFGIIGAAAAIDFDAFFSLFHSLFFAQGTWTFNSDSLLICLYPEGFWTGMGIVWVIFTALCCTAAFLTGLHMKRKSNHGE